MHNDTSIISLFIYHNRYLIEEKSKFFPIQTTADLDATIVR